MIGHRQQVGVDLQPCRAVTSILSTTPWMSCRGLDGALVTGPLFPYTESSSGRAGADLLLYPRIANTWDAGTCVANEALELIF